LKGCFAMRRRTMKSRLSKALCFMVFMVCVCLFFNGMTQISAARKKINTCKNEVEALNIEIQHLNVQIDIQSKPDRIMGMAYDLGMVEAGAEQKHLVSLPAGYHDATTVAQAADSQNEG